MILPDYVSADLEGKWGWSFPWILKSYWTNIGLNNTAFRKTRILLPSSSEYRYIRYWGDGGHIRPLCYPSKRIRIVGLKKRYSFVKYLKVLSALEENLWWAFLILFCPASASLSFCTIFSFLTSFEPILTNFCTKQGTSLNC